MKRLTAILLTALSGGGAAPPAPRQYAAFTTNERADAMVGIYYSTGWKAWRTAR